MATRSWFHMLYLFIIFSIIFHAISGYDVGAPRSACRQLKPTHWSSSYKEIQPQKTPSPYTIVIGRTAAQPNVLTVTIAGAEYGGFLLQGQSADGALVGTFSNPPSGTNVMACKYEADSITHTSDDMKRHLHFTWTAPDEYKGKIYMRGTVAYDRVTFWSSLEAESLIEEDPETFDPSCPIPMCSNRCLHGYQHNDRGCMTCICRQAPSDTVNLPTGPEDPEGFDPSCPTPMCSNQCPYGYQRNDMGCMTCTCQQAPLDSADRHLTPEDPDGFDPSCPTPMCSNRCPHGYQRNDQGCMTCTCREDPNAPADLQTETEDPDPFNCPMPMCSNRCPHGYQRNDQGCTICTCREDPGEGEKDSSGSVCCKNEL